MVAGALAFVLHGHLPYVRSRDAGSLEEDWYFQALIESYLPLLESLQRCADQGGEPRLTMSLSPTLLSLLVDPVLQERFEPWVEQRCGLLERCSAEEEPAAQHLHQHFQRQLKAFRGLNGQVQLGFQRLQQAGILDLITCSATHGYLPLLRDPIEAVQGQLRTAVREHERVLGVAPQGIWLPECAFYEGLDQQLAKVGLRYAVLDAHGLLHGLPRPRYGVYAPICSSASVAFFGRDSEATLPVWSASDGYPGRGAYREFHRDIGWELGEEELKAAGILSSRPLGLKLRRVSGGDCPLSEKLPYDPQEASRTAQSDAGSYVAERLRQLQELTAVMDRPPLVVAPFDAELFGHWWFEGPQFLEQVFLQGQAAGLGFSTLRQNLASQPQLQVCRPSPSSWGQGGYHAYWLSDSNAWVVPDWHRASLAMKQAVQEHQRRTPQQQRLLQQAARELLLAQSSDWSFILRAGTTTELARDRIRRHLGRFWRLLEGLKPGSQVDSRWLQALEAEDFLFPSINPDDWQL
ncbi:MAG: 1,4-alpha-glucan branching protein domain-containing protein [Synechococcus sp.]|nr:1,4-alpha-glucan branching protein domain-containing protein [Synechococcus sp.]